MKYIASLTKDGEILISTERSARNMSYQGFFDKDGEINIKLHLTGQVCFKSCKFMRGI